MLHQSNTLNCNGKLLALFEPVVMGIINVTEDSFYSGSRFTEKEGLLQQAEKLLGEGAAIIDIGGMSSRPGAKVISEEVELRRVLPAVKALKANFPEAVISIDTVHSEVARICVLEGAGLVNDISAGSLDPKMYEVVAELGVPYILMHMQRRPENMQEAPTYDDVVLQVLDFFIAEVGKLRALNVKDIVIDPGFGFGKTLTHNFLLLRELERFKLMGLPVMVGMSRKSMIYKTLESNAEQALNGTTALHMLALNNGAKILRAHDVKPAVEVIKLYLQLIEGEQS